MPPFATAATDGDICRRAANHPHITQSLIGESADAPSPSLPPAPSQIALKPLSGGGGSFAAATSFGDVQRSRSTAVALFRLLRLSAFSHNALDVVDDHLFGVEFLPSGLRGANGLHEVRHS